MKALHRPDLWTWSTFNAPRNIDFNSVLWVRDEGNIVFDPLPLSPHDQEHLLALGGADWIAVTTSDHLRDTAALASLCGAKVAGPAAERDTFPLDCDRWLSAGDVLVLGLETLEMHGSKTPGELAFLLEKSTLITGDLVRGQRAGYLNLLPDAKLADPRSARASVRGLLHYSEVAHVLVGDGWPYFHHGIQELTRLCTALPSED